MAQSRGSNHVYVYYSIPFYSAPPEPSILFDMDVWQMSIAFFPTALPPTIAALCQGTSPNIFIT
jgi:hypothetical protein